MAQQPAAGNWLTLRVPVQLNQYWQWHNDAGYRLAFPEAYTQQFFYRSGIRYQFNKQWSAAAGGALFFTRVYLTKENDLFNREERLWQELQYQHPLYKKIAVTHRLRTEQRFFDSSPLKQLWHAGRYRYRVQVTQPITEKWTLQYGDEMMMQSEKKDWQFDQNRVMITAQYQPAANCQLGLGYLWLLRSTGSQQIITLTLQKIISLHGNRHHSGEK
jgi:hypothetical protein